MTTPELEAELEAGFEAGVVRAGWELVQVAEQLGSGPAQRLLADRWDSERRRGSDGYRPLVTGDLVTPENTATYESPTNLARFRRTLDFVLAGDRVFEVGIGRGYLGTRVLREGGASAYLGIDLLEEYAAATRQTLAANGLATNELGDLGTAQTGDLYDLTRDQVSDFGADLLICCEVIEHVPDPEEALRVLAEALPEGTDLLISTPLLGRLEAVWEHVAIFGVSRLQRMLEAAGLTVHHVEPLANQWVLLLVSRSDRPSPRAAQAVSLGAPVVSPEPQPDLASTVTNVPVAKLEPLESRWNKRLAAHSVERLGLSAPDDAESLVIRLTAQAPEGAGDAAGRYGGVAFAVEQALGVRFELEPVDIDAATAVYADFYAGSSRVGRWKWDPANRPTKKRPTFILRPGLKGQFFKPVSVGDVRSADRVELFVQLSPGGSAELRLHRFAVVS